MPTVGQLNRGFRKAKCRRSRVPALQGNPFKKGVCRKIFIRTPKKPNSAQRKLARLRLTNKRIVTAYIPGQGHNLQEYSTVLLRGGRVKDLPGVQYHLVRGRYDFRPIAERRQRRSKFGVSRGKNPYITKKIVL